VLGLALALIAIGVLLFLFIVLQRVLVRTTHR
jgi:ABC-type glycerol-3-phosphate transport system permease component